MSNVTTINVPQGDFVTTTLNGAISSGATTMTIGTGLTLDANGGFLQIDYDSVLGLGVSSGPETIAYTSYTSGTGAVTGITRAQAGTTAVSHANGASVQAGTSSMYALNGTTLGYAQLTTAPTTTTLASWVDVGLSVAVTVPAGGRRVKITHYAAYISTSSAVQFNNLQVGIFEGATLLNESVYQTQAASANMRLPATVMWVGTPTAGAHTYKISYQQDNNAGTMTISATATNPEFILVELI